MAIIHIAEDRPEWVQFCVKMIIDAGQHALDENGRFVFALSGGSTPRPIYQALSQPSNQHELDWQAVHVLWSDERCVPLDHPKSNYRMARQALLDSIPIPDDHVHPMRCTNDPTAAAADYESILRELYPRQQWPSIDLVLLGMGTDGHTASLFPNSPALNERSRWVVANKAPDLETQRLTLTVPAINAARQIAFFVAGRSKADMVAKVLGDVNEDAPVPAGAIKPVHGELHWVLDAEAAEKIVDP